MLDSARRNRLDVNSEVGKQTRFGRITMGREWMRMRPLGELLYQRIKSQLPRVAAMFGMASHDRAPCLASRS
jgi:hypothetical protein